MLARPRTSAIASLLALAAALAAVVAFVRTAERDLQLKIASSPAGPAEFSDSRATLSASSTGRVPTAADTSSNQSEASPQRRDEDPSRRTAQASSLSRADVQRWRRELDTLQSPILDRLKNEAASSGEIVDFNKRIRRSLRALLDLVDAETAANILAVVPMYRVDERTRGLRRIDVPKAFHPKGDASAHRRGETRE